MKAILSFVFLCLVAGTASAKFAHDGPTPEYKSKFLTTMEGIHADAWESIQPFLDSLDTYVNQSVTAWKTFADEHKSSKAGRMFWAGAKKNMTGEIDSMLMASHTKISDVLASYQAKMEETAASWKGKHAAYDIEGKIGELQTYADETLMGFKGYLGHSPKSRRSLRGFWESYSSHNKTMPSKGSKGSLFSHSYDYAAKKAEFEAKLAGYKTDLESKMSTYKADHTAKLDGLKADIESKMSTYKADHTAKVSDAKSSIETKLSELKASKPSIGEKFSGRKLSGFWESYSSHNKTMPSKGSKGSLFSHSYDYAAKKAEFEAKLAGYKTDLESKMSTYKADHTAKLDGLKADIESKMSTYKADHTAKVSDAKSSIETKLSELKASKPSLAGKLSHN